jgi:hypothetical protein
MDICFLLILVGAKMDIEDRTGQAKIMIKINGSRKEGWVNLFMPFTIGGYVQESDMPMIVTWIWRNEQMGLKVGNFYSISFGCDPKLSLRFFGINHC